VHTLHKLPQVNVLGVVNVTQAALPCLRRSPAGPTNPGDIRGHLINVTSAAGLCAVPFADAWCRSAEETLPG
jgi:short-subunit dehydrogenase